MNVLLMLLATVAAVAPARDLRNEGPPEYRRQ